MKALFTILILLIGFAAQSQSLRVYKRAGASGELIYSATEINDTLAFYQLRPEEVQIGTSRDFTGTDVENLVRATASITLTIPLNFSAMAVDRTLTVLRAYSGSDLTIQAATGVTLNGVSGGSVTMGTAYTAGVLLKTGTNTYEFY